MENDFVEYTSTGFRFGYYTSEGIFIGTTVTGIDLTYDAYDYVIPTGGTVKSLMVTFEDTSEMGAPFINSFTLVKLPSVEDMIDQFNSGWFVPDTLFDLAASVQGERVLGNDQSNTFQGQDIADDFRGLGGDDLLIGGAGNDALRGGDGSDYLIGGADNDLLIGGRGNDGLQGDSGNDELRGSAGDDQLDGGEGQDTLEGGAGSDQIIGGQGADILKGGKGQDYLIGGEGDDRLEGGKGDDFLIGVLGDDLLRGGQGADIFAFTEDPAAAGRHIVRDFNFNEDSIVIQGYGYRDSLEVEAAFMSNAAQVGSSIVYQDVNSGSTVTFLSTDLDDLSSANFGSISGYANETGF